ncbi:MAG: hypothetical protein ABIP75_08870 [Pyrinomonadaceae bacterium]
MKNLKRIAIVFAVTALSVSGLSAQTQRSYQVANERQVRQIMQRITQTSYTFRNSINNAMGNNGRNGQQNINELLTLQTSFESATRQFSDRLNRRRAVAADAEAVLQAASPINDLVGRRRFNSGSQNEWAAVRSNLDQLATAYSLDWQWNESNQNSGNGNGNGYGNRDRLTGTYQLNASRSDNVRQVVERATANNNGNNDRQRMTERLQARLQSPEMLSIERNGSNVSLASSQAAQSTFTADGRQQSEQQANGRTTQMNATLAGERLVINSTGYRDTDFIVTFEPIENGRSLQVTRQIDSNQLTRPILVRSIYDRTSETAQWNVYNGTGTVAGTYGGNNSQYIVRDGESVVAVMNTDLTSKTANPGDRFTMTVNQPSQYAGATIEGTVASVDRGGRLTGRSQMTLSVETIRLRNGQTYTFAGLIESVRMQNGETVRVDNEGAVAENDNRTNTTVARTGIGTAIGAIIGAIAGGGKGAVIGGVVGAAGGAGSVYAQGKDDIELPRGTELTIRASAPSR